MDVVSAVLVLWPYLKGCRFTVRTDHDLLKGIFGLMDSKGNWRDGD